MTCAGVWQCVCCVCVRECVRVCVCVCVRVCVCVCVCVCVRAIMVLNLARAAEGAAELGGGAGTRYEFGGSQGARYGGSSGFNESLRGTVDALVFFEYQLLSSIAPRALTKQFGDDLSDVQVRAAGGARCTWVGARSPFLWNNAHCARACARPLDVCVSQCARPLNVCASEYARQFDQRVLGEIVVLRGSWGVL